MLNQLLRHETVLFADNISGWREAITTVSAPLLADGSITDDYVSAMIDSIAAGGTYIDLGFGIALAHSRPENGVVKTALSSLRVTPSVLLNDEDAHPIDLFFCLAAEDQNAHLDTMSQLASLLSDESRRTQLLDATDYTTALTVIDNDRSVS